MTCPACGAQSFESAPNGVYQRCNACKKLFMNYQGQLHPVSIPEGTDPDTFAKNVGIGVALPPDPITATKEAFKAKIPTDVGVRVKVGGVKLDVGTGGVAVDTSKLEKDAVKAVENKVSGWIWGCAFTIFFGLAVLCILGGVGSFAAYSWNRSAMPAAAESWDGTSAYTCPVNGNVVLEDVKANLSGTAVTAGGNCVLTLSDADISGTVAIKAGGNAVVTLSGGRIAGSENAIVVEGNAKVIVAGTKVEGGVKKSGGGKVEGM